MLLIKLILTSLLFKSKMFIMAFHFIRTNVILCYNRARIARHLCIKYFCYSSPNIKFNTKQQNRQRQQYQEERFSFHNLNIWIYLNIQIVHNISPLKGPSELVLAIYMSLNWISSTCISTIFRQAYMSGLETTL